MKEENKTKLYKAIAVISALAMVSGMSACARQTAVDPKASESTITIDYEAAEKEFMEYMNENKYLCSGIDGRYDVTGDGYEDLYANFNWGSGMPRDMLLFYDPVNHQVYNVCSGEDELSGPPYSYHVVSCDDNGLTVSRTPFDDSEDVVLGTVKPVDGELIFIEN